ncbi:MAG: RNA-binding transcriptional accessory protein [Anaerolineales bacterium]|nr:RNA-binding transcriptional accessory protein [Anaerolineales bacterium]
MKLIDIIVQETGISLEQVSAVISLLDEGNTIPFVARYRKEATKGLDEIQLRAVQKQLHTQRNLQDRRKTILSTIDQQGKLTADLRKQIEAARNRTALEDLYLAYKPRRRTRAQIAREMGLEPLAVHLLKQDPQSPPAEILARSFLSDDVSDADAAWDGAVDIAAERISENADIRRIVRQKAAQWGSLQCKKRAKAEDEGGVYQTYYAFEYRIGRLKPHQVLAINRGEREKVLSVSIDIADQDWKSVIDQFFPLMPRSPLAELFERARKDAGERLLLPAIARDLRRALTEQAEIHAIKIFTDNLEALLSQTPVPGVVLGIDPGFRTGSKLAVVDETGRLLETGTIYPHPPQSMVREAEATLAAMIERWQVTLIAIGNGTASRETEQLVAHLIKTNDQVHYLIVSEAGASVYSASPLAAQELPDLDVSIRGAVSIARRLQDPLSELVKIDPRSIGVGLYQHDVNQTELQQALHDVVESVVNQVGVDLNTASPALLSYVAGIGPMLAARIVSYRDEHGPFPSRQALYGVRGLGAAAFQQSAGFLRIHNGREPLDESAIHPESYPVAKALLERIGEEGGGAAPKRTVALEALLGSTRLEQLSADMQVGMVTLKDICEQLLRPGLDPRKESPGPILRRDILALEDLSPGQVLKGTVRNVVDFGAFVDIGVKQDGLLHRSKWLPGETYNVGQIIEVIVLDTDAVRKRIALGKSKTPLS